MTVYCLIVIDSNLGSEGVPGKRNEKCDIGILYLCSPPSSEHCSLKYITFEEDDHMGPRLYVYICIYTGPHIHPWTRQCSKASHLRYYLTYWVFLVGIFSPLGDRLLGAVSVSLFGFGGSWYLLPLGHVTLYEAKHLR